MTTIREKGCCEMCALRPGASGGGLPLTNCSSTSCSCHRQGGGAAHGFVPKFLPHPELQVSGNDAGKKLTVKVCTGSNTGCNGKDCPIHCMTTLKEHHIITDGKLIGCDVCGMGDDAVRANPICPGGGEKQLEDSFCKCGELTPHTTHASSVSTWRKEFTDYVLKHPSVAEIKSFIADLVEKAEEKNHERYQAVHDRAVEATVARIRHKLEGLKKQVGLGLAEDLHSVNGYNAALDAVLDLLASQ